MSDVPIPSGYRDFQSVKPPVARRCSGDAKKARFHPRHVCLGRFKQVGIEYIRAPRALVRQIPVPARMMRFAIDAR